MNRSRITGAILLRWEDCTSILSKHLTTLLQRPIQLCRMVEDYDYWCVASINGRFSIPELHSLLDALSATTVDFPDLIPEESNQTRSFSMEFSRALLQHGETLQYQGIYYALSNQRIPYRRDKTDDDRFFILTLFAIAYELQPAAINHAGIIRIQLAVGLPPAHYGAQQTKFSAYFLNRGPVQFIFHGIEFSYKPRFLICQTVFHTVAALPVYC